MSGLILPRRLAGAGGNVGGAAGISFVGEVTGVIDGAGSATQDISLSGISGLAAGDVLIYLTACDDGWVGGDFFPPHDLTYGDQNRWFPIMEFPSGAFPDCHLMAFVVGSSVPTLVRFHKPDTNDGSVIIQAWRGVDKRVIDARPSDAWTKAWNSSTFDPPSVTTVTDGALVIAVVALDDDDTTVSTWPTGYTNQVEENSGNASSGAGCTIAMSSKIVASAGAENPAAYTMSTSDDGWVCTVALQPDQSEVASWAIQQVGDAVSHRIAIGGGSDTISLPSGLQEDDYVIVFATADGNFVGGGPITSPMISSGWTELESVENSAGDWWVFTKKMGATPDTTVEIDDASSVVDALITILAFRGVDTTTPQDVAHSWNTGLTCPTITTVTANALVIRWLCQKDDPSGCVIPVGYVGLLNFIDTDAGSGNENGFGLAYIQQDSSGATGTLALTRTKSGETSAVDTGTMALRPA